MIVVEGQDYVVVSATTVTFQSGTTSNGDTECVEISIVNDGNYEKNEVFDFLLTSVRPASAIAGDSILVATKTITDNGGI